MSLVNQTKSSISHVKQAYEAVAEMGGVLPERKNLENLPTAINGISAIPKGDGTRWGTLYYGADDVLVLDSYEYYLNLGYPGSTPPSTTNINGRAITWSSIRKFSFGSACTFTPENFLGGTSGQFMGLEHTETLRYISDGFCQDTQGTMGQSMLDLPNVAYIGNTFLYNAQKFNAPINLPRVKQIGNNFLRQTKAFNSVILFGNNLKTIGSYFLAYSEAYNYPLYLPASLESVDSGFLIDTYKFTGLLTVSGSPTIGGGLLSLSVNRADAPAYAQGVRITGPGAAAWKEALPDLDGVGSFYRKLRVVEV